MRTSSYERLQLRARSEPATMGRATRGKWSGLHSIGWILVLTCTVAHLFASAAPARAQCPGAWPSTSNTGIEVTPGFSADEPAVAPDAAGGFFVAYDNEGAPVVVVTRVDAFGGLLWSTVAGSTGLGDGACSPGGGDPVICVDGAGGCFVAWVEMPTCGVGTIRAAHLTDAGAITWSAIVGASTPPSAFTNLRMAHDGGSGAWLAFLGTGGVAACACAGTSNILVNHVDVAGTVAFGTTGTGGFTCVCGFVVPELDAFIDPVFGPAAIVAHSIGIFPPGDIPVFKVALGGLVWAIPDVTAAGTDGLDPHVVRDGQGGAYVTWATTPATGAGDIHLAHVTSGGMIPPSAPLATRVICNDALAQSSPQIVSDAAGGAIVSWIDARNAGIYAQRVDDQPVIGPLPPTVYWAANGIPLTQVPFTESDPALISDGENGAVLAWVDPRGAGSDLYAQRVSGNGSLLWGNLGGVLLASGSNMESNPAVARIASMADLANPALGGPKIAFAFAWENFDPTTFGPQIRAQRMDYFGALGCAAPSITGATDIPGDQGGAVDLTWTRSYRDDVGLDDIDFYSVWRRFPSDMALAPGTELAAADLTRHRLETLSSEAAGRPAVRRILGNPPGLWELVGTQAAHHAAVGYSMAAATRADGTPHFFFVSAHSRRPGIWWDSNTMMVSSMDNLAPAAPSAFSAVWVPDGAPARMSREGSGALASGSIALHWLPNAERDFKEYRLHRGNSADFVPAPGNLITAQPDTGYVHAGALPGHYKLLAIDRHDNVSVAAVVSPQTTLGADPHGVAGALRLAPIAPNPVRGTCLMRFALPREADVTLSVFDPAGRMVHALARGHRPGGEHTVSWDGRDAGGRTLSNGIYFVRLEALGRALTERMVVMK